MIWFCCNNIDSFISFVQLAKRSLTSALTVSESLLTIALDSKVFWSSMQWVEELVLVWAPSYLSVCLLTMGRSPSLASLSILPHKSQHLSSNLTIVFFPPTPCLSTQMLPYFLTMRPYMTSVGGHLTLKGPPTPTRIALSLRYPLFTITTPLSQCNYISEMNHVSFKQFYLKVHVIGPYSLIINS